MLEKYKADKQREKLPAEKLIVFDSLPKFLEDLKEEILNDDSKIYDSEFKPVFQNQNIVSVKREHNDESEDSKLHSKRFKRENTCEDLSDMTVLKILDRIGDEKYKMHAEVLSTVKLSGNFENF